MSAIKFSKVVIVVGLVCSGLYVVIGNFLGPGFGDFSESLIGGYEYYHAGGSEIAIVYRGEERSETVVIDSRVDGYRVVENRLLVVRRPREIYQDNGVTKSRLSPGCEYWVINTESHEVREVERNAEFKELMCDGL